MDATVLFIRILVLSEFSSDLRGLRISLHAEKKAEPNSLMVPALRGESSPLVRVVVDGGHGSLF